MPRLALTLQLLLLVYHQVTTLCDFHPFNAARFFTRRERLTEAGVNLVLMGLPPLFFALGRPLLVEAGAAFYPILFAAECATWWVPYFFGPSPKWREIYARAQGRTLIVIPRRGDHPTPNLEHLILMALTLAAMAASLAAYRALPGPAFPHWWAIAPVAFIVVGGALYQTTFEGRV